MWVLKYFVASLYNNVNAILVLRKKRLLPHVTTYYQNGAESLTNNCLSKLGKKVFNFPFERLKEFSKKNL